MWAASFEAGKRALELDDYATAMRELRPLAEQGSAPAQLEVGFLYWFGQGVPRDQAEAEKWFVRAAMNLPEWRKNTELADPQAQLYVGLMLWLGKGVPKDYAGSRRLLVKAAEAGDREAQTSLANLYLGSDLFPRDDLAAANWMQRAAQQGYPEAQFGMGRMYLNGLGVKQDYGEAERWLRKAVQQGSLRGYELLGSMYQQGRGVAKDVFEAARLYQFAADKGFARGMVRLGLLFEDGNGVERDITQAVQWYRKASEQGSGLAYTRLGNLYFQGEVLRRIAQLGTDSKARRLKSELETCMKEGFDSLIVFTQYTDTMEYLRDYLADQLPSLPVASYSGAGGAWRDASGYWVPCSKEEIKRRLRDKQVRLLVCTDAAGEGLNLQFAGVLANYDLPWNPMKIEQRIGRIDRLGQERAVIRVLNFAYKDTVEQDVFFTVGTRINLFHGIVGRLQPILSRLPRRFEELTLLDQEGREAARQRFLAEIEDQVRDAEQTGLDIDATVDESLDLPPLPEPPLGLRDLDRVLNLQRARPPEIEWRPLDAGSYGIGLPGGDSIRVTTDAKVFDFSADSHQLFSPGGEVFDSFFVDSPPVANGGSGIAWLLRSTVGGLEFVVATRFGLQRVKTLSELLAALDVIGVPADFPLADWPGVTVSLIS